jgi:hypothetical protein
MSGILNTAIRNSKLSLELDYRETSDVSSEEPELDPGLISRDSDSRKTEFDCLLTII